MQLSHKEIEDLADHFNINQQELTDYVNQYRTSKKTGLWPERNKWWQKRKWIQELTARYSFLVPILDALQNHRAVGRMKTQAIISELHKTEKGEYYYVLLDISKSRKLIAGQVGCSQKTLALYIRGLVKCGVLRYFHCGPKKYYSLAYWMEYPVNSEGKSKEWDYKKVPVLNQKTSAQLKGFRAVM